MAVRSDGTVWAWGSNSYGQLGDGTTTSRSAPVQVNGLSGGLLSPQGLAAGSGRSLAVRPSGALVTWGRNDADLQTGVSVSRRLPGAVTGILNITRIAAGNAHSLVARSDGALLAWGQNSYGQLGDSTTISRSAPTVVSGLTNADLLSAAGFHSLAVRSDGTVWTWGANYSGQLGDGTTTSRNTPVQVSGLVGIVGIAAGGHSLAVRSDGTVWAWGSNSSGQLGDGTTSNRNTPVQVSGLVGIVSIAAGNSHSLAVRSDGTVWAWGSNYLGQLGDGTTIDRSVPVRVLTLAGVALVAAGSTHSLVLDRDGSVWSWGDNGYGQLGDGSTSSRSTPIRIGGLTDVTAIVVGHYHSIAVRRDGSLWAWGANYSGQVGNGANDQQTRPLPVAGISDVAAAAGGEDFTLALKKDGSVWAWGSKSGGKLGDDFPLQLTSPVPAIPLGSPDLSVRVSPPSVAPQLGDDATYHVRVTNSGIVGTSGAVQVALKLSLGLTLLSTNGAGWFCSSSGAMVSCSYSGSVPGGGSRGLAITVRFGRNARQGAAVTAELTNFSELNRDNDTGGAPIGMLGRRASRVSSFGGGGWTTDKNASFTWDGEPTDWVRSWQNSNPAAVPVTGDWNGDGRVKMGAFMNGTWVLDYNGNGIWDGPSIDKFFVWGNSGDVPVVGDWNGDGVDKVGVFTPTSANWLLDWNGNFQWDGGSFDRAFLWGSPGDIPVVGDWAGTGFSKVGVFNSSQGWWVIDYNGNQIWEGSGIDWFLRWGSPGDRPVVGDWDGDGRTNLGAFNPSQARWVLDMNGNYVWDGDVTDRNFAWGSPGDLPVVGDWGGSGGDKVGVFNPAQGWWVVDFNGNFNWDGATIDRFVRWGQAGDLPRPAAW